VRSPHVPWRDTIVYELHVKGYTQRHPSVPPELRGKYLGLGHPAVTDHLKRLGITTVELMPCQAFVSEQPLLERGLVNYWGYNPIAWFAPDARYAVADPVVEFKTMVRALHAAGLEVVLDVVFNHTAEGDHRGPTLSWRGFDNASYYRPGGSRPECVQQLHRLRQYRQLRRCLRARTGARLSALLGRRDAHRRASASTWPRCWDAIRSGYSSLAPFFASLRSDPVLAHVKFIAEPWDVGPGGYQLGHFPAGWSEWNDRYRDAVRAYWRGDAPLPGHVCGAPRRLERPVPSPRPQADCEPQFRRRARRPSRCTTRSRTTIGTTKRTSRTAWTATRTT
jgi:glycogen operon protein